MDKMSPGDVVTWISQLKELIALLALLAYSYHREVKHIPFLLMRETERARLETENQRRNNEAMVSAMEKLGAQLKEGIEDLKDAVVLHQQTIDRASLQAVQGGRRGS